jgi:hypothetical protein
MSDTARQGAPHPDNIEARHTLTVRDVEALFAQAGVQRSHRHVLRLCQSGMLDAVKIPGGPSGEEWYVASASVPKAIGDLKQIDSQRARRSPPQHVTAEPVVAEIANAIERDTARHGTMEPGASDAKNMDKRTPTEPDTAGRVMPDHDIYNHPYVKRLEDRIDKLETKYEAQVRRTEEIQLKGQSQLLELQRMTAVGQSQTLADFMLKARDWVLGQGVEAEKRETEDKPSAT